MSDEVTAAIAAIRRARLGESPFDDPAVRELFALAENSDPAGLAALVLELIPALGEPNAYHASCIAITCGTLVELGADPNIAGLAIVERLKAAADTRDRATMQMFDQAAMAHLCRSKELRIAARRLPGATTTAQFTTMVLDFVDDLELLILAPVQTKGFRVRLEAVATNAHLFTLLQAALAGELASEPVDPDVIAIATGEAPHRTVLTDRQRFRFDSWPGLLDATTFHRDMRSWIPVEGSPRDIPALPDGRRVVLLGPPLLAGRSWESTFFANIHDALRSRVAIEAKLTPAQVQAELTVIVSLVGTSS